MTKVVFTLVHGTFAKGADWVVHEKSETFCRDLKKVLAEDGGSDSNGTRRKFGEAFAATIKEYEERGLSKRDETARTFCERLRKILRYVSDDSPGRIARAVNALAKSKLANTIEAYEKKEATFRTQLRNSLRDSLPEYEVEFDDCFVWGHDKQTRFLDNTESTRSDGIHKLKEHLRSRTESSPPFHFVVAHSHGGNVALQAMNDKDIRDSITGVVCLATPFLFPRNRQLPGRLFFWCVVGLAILAVVLYQNPTYLSPALRYLLFTLIVLYALALVVQWRGFKSEEGPAKNYRSVEDMDDKLMVIRPSGDEASGLLRTNQFITWCLGRILASLYWLVGTLIGVAMGMRYVSDWGKQGFEWFGRGEAFTKSVGAYVDRVDFDPIFAVLLIAAGAIIVLLAVQWLVVSFDDVGWFAKVEMLAEEAPPGMRSQSVILEPAQREGERKLVHTGIYNRPQTIAEIAKWVKEKEPNSDGAKASTSVEAVSV